MNNKIKKYCEITLLCCLCVGFVAGNNNLKIFRNVGDTIVEVSSKIELPSGANLTLICQIENIKNKGIINGFVTWFIPPEIHSEVKFRTLKNSSDLVFRNFNTNNEGLYVCGSLKYNIFKSLRLLLKQSEFAKPSYLNIPKLTKREVIFENGPHVYNYTDTIEYGRKLAEMKKESERMRDDLLREIEKERKNKEDELYNNNNNNYDISSNNREDSHTNTSPLKPVAFIFGALLAVFVVFLLIRFCGYMSQSPSERTRSNCQPNVYNPGVTVPRPNRCGHTSCSGNYLLNPADACRLHDDILPSAPIIYDGIDIERPLTHNTGNPTTQLDLPPTYSSSTHNSTENINDATIGFNKTVLQSSNDDNLNLPPSYDEAIHNNDTAS